MGNSQGSYNGSQTNVNIQSMYNNTQFNNTILCQSSCGAEVENVYILIENSTTGDVNFVQECTSSSSCVLENDIEYINSIQQQNIQSSSIDVEKFAIPNTTGASKEDTDIYVRVRNFDVQSSYTATTVNINTTCKSVVNNVQENIYLVIKNTTTGDVNFTQKGNTVSSCSSVNSSKSSETVNLLNTEESLEVVKENVQFSSIIGIIFFGIFSFTLFIYISFFTKNKNEEYIEKPKTINITKIPKKDINVDQKDDNKKIENF